MATYTKAELTSYKMDWASGAEVEPVGEVEGWLQKIETEIPLIEIIDEKFFGACHMMTPGSVIYGGTIAAVILGEKIQGDLDIAAGRFEAGELVERFIASPKWIRNPKNALSMARQKKYAESCLKGKIEDINTFRTFDKNLVQIVSSSSMLRDGFENALYVVRNVDFSFCALAMDYQGNLFETVQGAYADCIAKRIRIIRKDEELNVDSLRSRLNKYFQRGFSFDGNHEEVIKRVAELKAKSPVEPDDGLSKHKERFKSRLNKCLDTCGHKDRVCIYFTFSFFNEEFDYGKEEFVEQLAELIEGIVRNSGFVGHADEDDPPFVEVEYNADGSSVHFVPYGADDGNSDWNRVRKEVIETITNQYHV
jgi:hypothetical protein